MICDGVTSLRTARTSMRWRRSSIVTLVDVDDAVIDEHTQMRQVAGVRSDMSRKGQI